MIERAYYKNTITGFLGTSVSEILGELAIHNQFDLEISQRNAWNEQIADLQMQLEVFHDGSVFFEFSIPRMGKRVDVVLILGGVIFVLEYKVGAKSYEKYAIDQVQDYALDLKNFHEGSHDKYLVPVVVSTKAACVKNEISWFSDRTSSPLLSNGNDLAQIITLVLSSISDQVPVDPDAWVLSGYKPTPTIVEAAQALYRDHSVEEISRSDAGAKNLTDTTDCIFEIIDSAKKNRNKSICFVTGVPGAGKTLAGLNISTKDSRAGDGSNSVFLSGYGPLVDVLREALVRDKVARAQEKGKRLSKKAVASEVNAFIQNIHHFRDEALRSSAAPPDHVVVFDEAQRAWDRAHAEKFMRQKRGLSAFEQSEPEFLISVMDRHLEWCTIVCLIGGGQEINPGEAGLTEWFDALQKRFRKWKVYYPSQIAQKSYSWGQDLCAKAATLQSTQKEELHLAVSMRSFRAEKLSDFIGAVVDGTINLARQIYNEIKRDYPIVLTRDVEEARAWLQQKARGTERFGLVASSGGLRLKAEGINVKTRIDTVSWFLNPNEDVRSSFYLEDVATEFSVQGLELDWTCVCWDADFRMENGKWGLYAFKGTRWQHVNDKFRAIYLANAYRVLLTRGRQGMVIFVPRGDESDYTRPPCYYDETFSFLMKCGIREISLNTSTE